MPLIRRREFLKKASALAAGAALPAWWVELDSEKVDVVLTGTRDHGHTLVNIAAMRRA